MAYLNFINLPVHKSYTVNERADTLSLEIGIARLLGIREQLLD